MSEDGKGVEKKSGERDVDKGGVEMVAVLSTDEEEAMCGDLSRRDRVLSLRAIPLKTNARSSVVK